MNFLSQNVFRDRDPGDSYRQHFKSLSLAVWTHAPTLQPAGFRHRLSPGRCSPLSARCSPLPARAQPAQSGGRATSVTTLACQRRRRQRSSRLYVCVCSTPIRMTGGLAKPTLRTATSVSQDGARQTARLFSNRAATVRGPGRQLARFGMFWKALTTDTRTDVVAAVALTGTT